MNTAMTADKKNDSLSAIDDQSDIYRSLLESTQAIPWKIDWASKQYVYVGPQIEALLGWRTQDWTTVQDWADRIHPDERDQVVNRCVAMSIAGEDHEADYRALTADHRYVWVRETVHVLRNAQGETEALVGFLFDINERKKNEEKLQTLQRELEALSYQDGLTQIANRRRFDEVLAHSWARALARQKPLSLLLLDIDLFKQYNDHYGHLQGDACLVSVAKLLTQTLDSPNDLVARYGGEEFVVLLPDVSAHIAHQVALRFARILQEHPITHPHSTFNEQLTVSIGVHTLVPHSNVNPSSLIETADRYLYKAKNLGRNRIVSDLSEQGPPDFCAF